MVGSGAESWSEGGVGGWACCPPSSELTCASHPCDAPPATPHWHACKHYTRAGPAAAAHSSSSIEASRRDARDSSRVRLGGRGSGDAAAAHPPLWETGSVTHRPPLNLLTNCSGMALSRGSPPSLDPGITTMFTSAWGRGGGGGGGGPDRGTKGRGAGVLLLPLLATPPPPISPSLQLKHQMKHQHHHPPTHPTTLRWSHRWRAPRRRAGRAGSRLSYPRPWWAPPPCTAPPRCRSSPPRTSPPQCRTPVLCGSTCQG